MEAIQLFGNAFGEAIHGGVDSLTPAALSLTRTFMIASVFVVLFRAAGGNSQNAIRSVLVTLFIGGGVMTAIEHAEYIKEVIMESFVTLGLRAGNSEMSAVDFIGAPGAVMVDGFGRSVEILKFATASCNLGRGVWGVVSGCVGAIELVAPMFAVAAIVLGVYLYAAYKVLSVAILFALSTLTGLVMLPMFIFQPTSRLGWLPLNGFLTNGIKMMLLAIVVSLGGKVLSKLTVGTEPGLSSVLSVLIGTVIYAGLIFQTGKLAAALTSGGLFQAGSLLGAPLGVAAIAARTAAGPMSGATGGTLIGSSTARAIGVQTKALFMGGGPDFGAGNGPARAEAMSGFTKSRNVSSGVRKTADASNAAPPK